ncbi:MAG: SCO family protein, partial [Sneathiella sp.]|nr:SCO family protein [Sneathiella sp.]
LLITVDPENDTVDTLKTHVSQIHPRLIGLTGMPENLAEVRRAYNVDVKPVEGNWKGSKVYSHGTFIYLMGPDGKFLTLLPPFMDPVKMAATIQRYVK